MSDDVVSGKSLLIGTQSSIRYMLRTPDEFPLISECWTNISEEFYERYEKAWVEWVQVQMKLRRLYIDAQGLEY